MRTLVGTMLFVSALLGSEAAQAQSATEIPPGCQESAFSQRAYNNGVNQGISLVDRAWGAVNDCDKLEQFSDTVIDNVSDYVLGGKTSYVICRYTGMVDGVYAELDKMWMKCGGDCCSEGEAIGEMAAELYCQLSILLQGLVPPDFFIRRPVFTCGFSFQVCCDAVYDAATVAYPSCQPYTVDPFADAWTGTRNVQCAYTPKAELELSVKKPEDP